MQKEDECLKDLLFKANEQMFNKNNYIWMARNLPSRKGSNHLAKHKQPQLRSPSSIRTNI